MRRKETGLKKYSSNKNIGYKVTLNFYPYFIIKHYKQGYKFENFGAKNWVLLSLNVELEKCVNFDFFPLF